MWRQSYSLIFFICLSIIPASNGYANNITIYPAKTIITLEDNQPYAEAVAVRGGKFAGIGTLAELQAAFPSAQIDHRFGKDIIVPGFIEQHIHPFLGALAFSTEVISIESWNLPQGVKAAVRTPQAYRDRLQAALNAHEGDAPFVTWGYHHYFHGALRRAELDAMRADIPILIWHRSAHEFIFNSKALDHYGISADYIASLGQAARKHISYDEGHFYEQGLLAITPKVLPRLTADGALLNGLMIVEDYLKTAGVTLYSEPGGLVSRPIQDAVNHVLGDLDSPRGFFIADGRALAEAVKDEDGIIDPQALLDQTAEMRGWGAGMTSFLPKQVKLFSDGAVFSQAMQMREGYLDGHDGTWMMEEDIFKQAFRIYWEAGYQIHIHQNGDAGLDRILDTLEDNMRRFPRQDHRTTIIHFGYSAPDQIDRIERLGAIISANPYYVRALSDIYSRMGVGAARSQQMVRLGDAVRASIPVALHSDMPMAPAQPLYLMWAAMNRINFADKVAGENQRLTALQALRAVTLDAAFSLRLEDDYGSIRKGKYANLTILSANPLATRTHKIKDIRVKASMIEGHVYKLEDKGEE